MYQGGRCKFYNPKYSHCLPWLNDQFLVIHSFITETTVQCEKSLNNEVVCHRLLWISWVGLHNMESSGCFKYKKFPTPRSSVLSLAVFIFEVCPSKPNSEEQNKDDGRGWVTILNFFPSFFFCLLLLSSLSLLVSWGLGCEKISLCTCISRGLARGRLIPEWNEE